MIQILDSLEIDVELHDLFLPTWTLWKSAMTFNPWHLNTKSPCLQDEWKIRLPNKTSPPLLPASQPKSSTSASPASAPSASSKRGPGKTPTTCANFTTPGNGRAVVWGKWWDWPVPVPFNTNVDFCDAMVKEWYCSLKGRFRPLTCWKPRLSTAHKNMLIAPTLHMSGSPPFSQSQKLTVLYKGLIIGTRSKNMQHEQLPLVSDDMQCFTSSKGFSLTCRREQTSRLDSEVDHRNLSATNANQSSNWVINIFFYCSYLLTFNQLTNPSCHSLFRILALVSSTSWIESNWALRFCASKFLCFSIFL